MSFSVERGRSVALLGPNGAGKSTLLLHMNGLLRGDGTVKILGRKVEEESLPWVRSRVGMVFQDPDDQLFMPNLREDVAFGPLNLGRSGPEMERDVSWALEAVGLEDLEGKSPHHLSFGQRKRAALATVLSMRPEILVMDEPTSNLDPRSKRAVVSLIRELCDYGTTIITATHDVNIVTLMADEILLLDKRVVGYGPLREVLEKREVLDSLGLEVPILVDLFHSLKGCCGHHFHETPITKDEAVEGLKKILG